MDVQLLDKRDVPLLLRSEVSFLVNTDQQTPSRNDLRKAIAKSMGVKDELVVVKKILTQYGRRSSSVVAHIYKSVDDAKRIEGAPISKKHYPQEKAEAKQGEVKAE